MKRGIILLLFVGIQIQCLSAQVSIHIESLAENTPENANIFFAGNINGWDPGSPFYKLEIRSDGDYWMDLDDGSGTVEFKFTRGSWELVESNGNGGYRPNRTFTFGTVDTLHLSILGWEDLDGGGNHSTANEQVQILDEAMYMPQLDRSRRVWVYLPKDYDTTLKSYPVLYMQDGQNVFDDSTSFAGEWKVDETLSELEDAGFRGVIVVAIDNGGTHRIDEYSPFVNEEYGGGEGDAYLDFIINTLKPKVDSTFRTMEEPKHTGIMGSSMGGLIAHYAHFRNPDVFGKAGIFSPSYWFSEEYFSFTQESGKTENARIYLYAGMQEWTIASDVLFMNEQLVDMGYSEEELKMHFNPHGYHSELYWSQQFPDAVQWLFENEELLNAKQEDKDFLLYPNPVRDKLICEGPGEMQIKIYDMKGKLLIEKTIEEKGSIDLQFNSKIGIILVQVFQDDHTQLTKLLRIR